LSLTFVYEARQVKAEEEEEEEEEGVCLKHDGTDRTDGTLKITRLPLPVPSTN